MAGLCTLDAFADTWVVLGLPGDQLHKQGVAVGQATQ